MNHHRHLSCAILATVVSLCGCARRASVSPPQAIVGGTVWRTANLPSRATNITSNGNALWICGADELIAESQDGKTWEVKHRKAGGSVLSMIAFSNDRIGFASGTDGALFLTVNGGSGWALLSGVGEDIYSASFSDARDGIIETPTTIKYTHNGGTTWRDVTYVKSADDLRRFQFVLSLAVLDPNRMAILLKEGPATYYDQRIALTEDGGMSWKTENPQHTVLGALIVRQSEYWALGIEVVDRRDHGGHSVSLVMHSSDAEKWSKQMRPTKETENCTSSGCLLWNGAGVDPFGDQPSYWTFLPEQMPSAKWAATGSTICAVNTGLRCTEILVSSTVPTYEHNDPIPAVTSLPVLRKP